MAEFLERYPLNASGKFYIDAHCVDCGICAEAAPNNICRDDRAGMFFISRQPRSPEEFIACENAVRSCPTEALGDDGDQFDWEHSLILDWNSMENFPHF